MLNSIGIRVQFITIIYHIPTVFIYLVFLIFLHFIESFCADVVLRVLGYLTGIEGLIGEGQDFRVVLFLSD